MNLYDVSNLTADALSEQIDLRYQLLYSVAQRLELEPEKRKENLVYFKPVSKAFNLLRIGFCDENGISYATNGKETDLSYREFFKRSMKGEIYISDVLKDALDDKHEDVTILSCPLHDVNQEINGVVGITYRTKELSQDLALEIFEGEGMTIIFNEAGYTQITSKPEILDIHENVFDVFYAEMGNKFETKRALLDDIFVQGVQENSASTEFVSINKTDYYYHLKPVQLLDGKTTWTVLSMVPVSYLENRFTEARRNLYRMVFFVVLFGLCSVGIVQGFSYKQWFDSQKAAYFSSITGGPNQLYMNLILKRNSVNNGYMVNMNIENFKHTSVAIGSQKTQSFLKNVWKVLQKEESADEFFCHEKEDSFFLFMRVSSEVELKKRLLTLQLLVREEAIRQNLAMIVPKFGVYLIQEEKKIEDAWRRAELAIQYALNSDRSYAFYDEEKQQAAIENQNLEEHFKTALKDEEFKIYFQPKYSVQEKRIVGAEALVRWFYKNEKLVSPVKFISMLEKSGKINRLDIYIWRKVCEKQAAWKKSGKNIVPVSVNISKSTLYRNGIVDQYVNILKEYDLDPKDIQLEVTESLISGGTNMANLLNQFRSKGIKVLMDDFGTGYTALSTLNLQCFDTLKIDKSLIDGLNDDSGRELVACIVDMGKRLGYHLTAEGVETEDQYGYLREMNCDDIQGYYFSKPETSTDFETRLT